MGFLLRSAFWLGIVYSAMPLDVASLTPAATAPAAISALCPFEAGALKSCFGAPTSTSASTCAGGPAALCAGLQAAAAGMTDKQSDDATPASAKRRRPSSDTLTDRDRVQPWRGPPARSQG